MNKIFLCTWFERFKLPALGVKGGKSAKPPIIIVKDNFGEKKAELLKTNGFQLRKGWKVPTYSGGGGGYGDPYEREPDRVLNDYVNEYISQEHAQKEYGVVIAESGNIDYEATKKLRNLL
jgi:N-methylhydantoinase B